MAYSTSLDLDPGGSDSGPWLTWHAAPTRDGSAQPGQWSVRDSAGRAVVNLTAPGLVIDWPNARIGWMRTSGVPGVAPEKQWSEDRAKLGRRPGEDWKKAVRVSVAYAPDAAATWEQAGVGACATFAAVMALLRENAADAQLPKLPLLSFVGHDAVRVGAGTTLVGKFKLLRFVPRPLCLAEEEDDAEPVGPSWDTPTGKLLDDEIPW
jgi:hypothetical protein